MPKRDLADLAKSFLIALSRMPDPNRLTAEDREIMEREQAEADAAERRAQGVGQ